MAIYPTPEQIEKRLAGPAEQLVGMVDLLTFKPRADARAGEVRGETAYPPYGQEMRESVEAHGGRILWAGRADATAAGEDGDPEIDMVAPAEVSSRQTFVEITSNEHVRAIGRHPQRRPGVAVAVGSNKGPILGGNR